MSLRMLLRGAPVDAVVEPPVDPPVDPPVTPPGWPTSSDPVLAAIRPSGRVVSTQRVGTGQPHTTVGAALSAANTSINNDTPYGLAGPDYRSDVLVAAGTYTEANGAGGWRSIVGATGNPADVVLQTASQATDGVIHPYGASYVEGVTLKALSAGTTSPKYCAHLTGGPIQTFANVIFDASQATLGAASEGLSGTVGTDGEGGMTVLFYKCKFINPVGAPPEHLMNNHGGPQTTEPLRYLFIDCDAPHGVSAAGPGTTDGDPDEVYVIGGNVGSVTSAPTTRVFVSSATIPVIGTDLVTRGVTTWPTYTGGLPAPWSAYYRPFDVASSAREPAVSDAAPMAPVAGRTYYVPVPTNPGGKFLNFGFTATTAVGLWSGRLIEDQMLVYGSLVPANRPALPAPLINVGPVVAGVQWKAGYYPYSRYPGSGRLWVALKFADAAVRVRGSASLAGLMDCYYSDDDGDTITKAAAGSVFPLASIKG